ncbi:MAG: hypothetical protein ACPG8W_26235 [Candidatus Promineifilaceae bacterium]
MGQLSTIILAILFVIIFAYVVLSSRWLMGALLISSSLYLGWFAIQLHHDNGLLRESAENIPAVIVDMNIQKRTRQANTYHIYLEYRSLSDGTLLTDRHGIPQKQYRQTKIGDTIQLMTATTDPTVTILAQYYPPQYAPPFLFIPFIILGLVWGVSVLCKKEGLF